MGRGCEDGVMEPQVKECQQPPEKAGSGFPLEHRTWGGANTFHENSGFKNCEGVHF